VVPGIIIASNPVGNQSQFDMSAANSGLPQGAFPGHEALAGQSRIRLAVFTVLGIHAVVLMGVLIQGCKQTPPISQTTPLAIESPASHTKAEASGPLAAPLFQPVIPVVDPKAATHIQDHPTLPSPRVYTVAEGDGFYKIARAHGISLKSLTDANPGVDSTKLKIGQKLNLPDPKQVRKSSAG
jgi:LysM repeat protein